MRKGNTKMLVDTYRKKKKIELNRKTRNQKVLYEPVNPPQATTTYHCFPEVIKPVFKMLRLFAPNSLLGG